MSNNILNDIENAIYEVHIKWTDEYPGEPKLAVLFSPEGYNRARYEKMASVFFNRPTHCGDDTNTFAGYPYEVIAGQVESFKIKVEGL